MHMAEIIAVLMGIIFLFFGIIAYKYPKSYLEVFGARILILFKEKDRIKILKLIALGSITLAIILIISGLLG